MLAVATTETCKLLTREGAALIKVFDVFYGTTHDGPGMRTTFFLIGCPLRCEWCHNPEGISPKRQVWWDGRKCIGCLSCKDQCQNGALELDEQGVHIDRERCIACGLCAEQCPARALSVIGRDRSAADMVREAQKYCSYYDSFGGGVTLSGGEPLLQADQIAPLLEMLRKKGIHTAVDSCGCVPKSALEKVLPHTCCILYDLKLMDTQEHQRFTGVGNERILENFRYLLYWKRERNPELDIWVRTPLIPGATDTQENICAIAKFLISTGAVDQISRWELCAFNNVCEDKYRKLGTPWTMTGVPLMKQQQLVQVQQWICDTGFPVDKLVISGLAAEK